MGSHPKAHPPNSSEGRHGCPPLPECRVQRGVSGWLKVPQAGGGREQVTSILPDPCPVRAARFSLSPVACGLGHSPPRGGDNKARGKHRFPKRPVCAQSWARATGRDAGIPTLHLPRGAPRRRPSCPGRGQRRTSGGGREGRGLHQRELSAPTPSKEGLWEPEAWGEGPLRLLPWGRGRGGEEWGPADSGISGCGHHDRPRASEVERPRPAVGPGAHPCCPGTGHKQESPGPPQLPGQPAQEAPHLSRRPELEGAPRAALVPSPLLRTVSDPSTPNGARGVAWQTAHSLPSFPHLRLLFSRTGLKPTCPVPHPPLRIAGLAPTPWDALQEPPQAALIGTKEMDLDRPT